MSIDLLDRKSGDAPERQSRKPGERWTELAVRDLQTLRFFNRRWFFPAVGGIAAGALTAAVLLFVFPEHGADTALASPVPYAEPSSQLLMTRDWLVQQTALSRAREHAAAGASLGKGTSEPRPSTPAEARLIALGNDLLAASTERLALQVESAASSATPEEASATLRAATATNLKFQLPGLITSFPSDSERYPDGGADTGALHHERLLQVTYGAQQFQVPSTFSKAALLSLIEQQISFEENLSQTLPSRPDRPVPTVVSSQNRPHELTFWMVVCLGTCLGCALGFVVTSNPHLTRPVSPGEQKGLVDGSELGVIPDAAQLTSLYIPYAHAGRKESALGFYQPSPIPSNDAIGLRRWNENFSSLAVVFQRLMHSLTPDSSAPRGQSYFVTSTHPGEGKTSIAASLAVALSTLGSRVLMIDADIRNPSIHTVFHLDNSTGLRNLLNAGPELEQIPLEFLFYRTALSNLAVLPAGIFEDAATGALDPVQFAVLLGRVAPHFDIVLIDSATVSDLLNMPGLAGVANGAILVLRSTITGRAEAAENASLLASRGIVCLGTILNGADSAATADRNPRIRRMLNERER